MCIVAGMATPKGVAILHYQTKGGKWLASDLLFPLPETEDQKQNSKGIQNFILG